LSALFLCEVRREAGYDCCAFGMDIGVYNGSS
jgi:hypothetical protein